jgi:hypothetical protein
MQSSSGLTQKDASKDDKTEKFQKPAKNSFFV